MIKVEVNEGFVHVSNVEGDGVLIMSELCCMVSSVCTAYCSDEEDGEEMTKQMILLVSNALREHVSVLPVMVNAKRHDQNFDF